jgi:protocatechuate 4,5-dioxygenase beta chain
MSCNIRRPRGRCFNLGKAIARRSNPSTQDLNVQIWGTGGMSHQLQGPRAGLINKNSTSLPRRADRSDPEGSPAKPHIDYVREAGSEGIELVMWLIMRGAWIDEVVQGTCYRFYHVPASNTAVGHLILENRFVLTTREGSLKS